VIERGPTFERSVAAALLILGGVGLLWLHTRVDWLEKETSQRLAQVRAVERLRVAGPDLEAADDAVADDPFPDHELCWQNRPVGRWLCLRPISLAEAPR
jgi:hypothetical protein